MRIFGNLFYDNLLFTSKEIRRHSVNVINSDNKVIKIDNGDNQKTKNDLNEIKRFTYMGQC